MIFLFLRRNSACTIKICEKKKKERNRQYRFFTNEIVWIQRFFFCVFPIKNVCSFLVRDENKRWWNLTRTINIVSYTPFCVLKYTTSCVQFISVHVYRCYAFITLLWRRSLSIRFDCGQDGQGRRVAAARYWPISFWTLAIITRRTCLYNKKKKKNVFRRVKTPFFLF